MTKKTDGQKQQRSTYRAAKAIRNRTEAIGNLQRVPVDALREMDRRFALVAADSMPTGGAGKVGGSSDPSGPTLRAVVRAWDEPNKRWRDIGHDEVSAAIAASFEDLEIIEKLSKAVEHRCQFVMGIGVEEFGRQSELKTCQACQRTVSGSEGSSVEVDDDVPDMIVQGKLRAGYCPACYQAWRYQGQPDRFYFECSRAAKYRLVGEENRSAS